jgi:hypothetical protein
MKTTFRKLSIVCATTASLAASSQAATINQTTNPPAGTDWNQTSVWGGNAVIPSNDYASAALGGASATSFIVNGTTWASNTNVRDSTGTSTFGGGSLILNSNTRLLMKAIGSPATSTANIVLNGGYISAAPNGGGTTVLAGTINNFAGFSAIGMQPFAGTTQTFNINSTITGGGLLQFTQTSGQANTIAHMNLNGDISSFTGTLYFAQAATPTSVGSDFSIAGSAPLATLQFATGATSFLFNVNNNISFSSVILNGGALAPGTYSVSDLNGFAGGKFAGLGSITVIPEPSTIGLGVVGLLGLLAVKRRRPLKTGAAACVAVSTAILGAQAATIDQTTTNPPAGTDWNQPSVWGDNAVVPTDDYNMVPGATQIGQSFTAQGVAWRYFGQVRDSTTTSIFGGGKLLINDATRLLLKAIDPVEAISTADIILNGGHIISAPNSGGTVTLAGTIDLQAPLGAIGSNAFGGSSLIFNIDSTITGSGTLQLVETQASSITQINVRGNISNFAGEFYLACSEGIAPGAGSSFSFASGIAPLATLNLAVNAVNSTNFLFDLNSDISFGSVIVGETFLDPGTYTYADLDLIAPGKFLPNGGSITVIPVPEPSTVALLGFVGLVSVFGCRRLSGAKV